MRKIFGLERRPLSGQVLRGDAKISQLSFPTENLAPTTGDSLLGSEKFSLGKSLALFAYNSVVADVSPPSEPHRRGPASRENVSYIVDN